MDRFPIVLTNVHMTQETLRKALRVNCPGTVSHVRHAIVEDRFRTVNMEVYRCELCNEVFGMIHGQVRWVDRSACGR